MTQNCKSACKVYIECTNRVDRAERLRLSVNTLPDNTETTAQSLSGMQAIHNKYVEIMVSADEIYEAETMCDGQKYDAVELLVNSLGHLATALGRTPSIKLSEEEQAAQSPRRHRCISEPARVALSGMPDIDEQLLQTYSR